MSHTKGQGCQAECPGVRPLPRPFPRIERQCVCVGGVQEVRQPHPLLSFQEKSWELGVPDRGSRPLPPLLEERVSSQAGPGTASG